MKQIKEAVREVVHEPSPSSIGGFTFDEVVEKTWRKLVANAMMELIDEGKISHFNNRYFAGPAQ